MLFNIKSLALHFDSIMVWGLLMALLYNAFLYFGKIKENSSTLIVSFIMFLSYYSSYEFLDLSIGKQIYLVWATCDIVTIIVIFSVLFLTKLQKSIGVTYVFWGLSINTFLFLGMYFDTVVLGTSNPWWFWSFYSMTINIVDFLMAISLILNVDWLYLNKFKILLTNSIRKKALS